MLVASGELIERARRWRKMLGGGMRQAGVLAAAGLYALEHHRERLADDHAMAAAIGECLASIEGIDVTSVQTNMVFADFSHYPHDAAARLDGAGILAAAYPGMSRFVTHLDLPEHTAEAVHAALA